MCERGGVHSASNSVEHVENERVDERRVAATHKSSHKRRGTVPRLEIPNRRGVGVGPGTFGYLALVE